MNEKLTELKAQSVIRQDKSTDYDLSKTTKHKEIHMVDIENYEADVSLIRSEIAALFEDLIIGMLAVIVFIFWLSGGFQ